MHDLTTLNTLRLPAFASAVVPISRSTELYTLASQLDGQQWFILGGGSNLVLNSSASTPLSAVVLQNQLSGIVRQGVQPDGRVRIRCAGGEPWHRFVMWTLAQGLGGLENLALIPGTVGASPVQNIGAYGVEVCDRIAEVHAWDLHHHTHVSFSNEACGFGYRQSQFKDPNIQGPWNHPRYLIVAVDFLLWPAAKAPRVLDYAGLGQSLNALATPLEIAHTVIGLRRRKLPSPDELPNVGSFFKNPVVDAALAATLVSAHPELPAFPEGDHQVKLSAGWLIEATGMKGCRRGDAGVYEQHALVLVNHGRASASELLHLAREVQQAVMARFGIWLEPEPQVIPPLVEATSADDR